MPAETDVMFGNFPSAQRNLEIPVTFFFRKPP
jgi:hypothetical protein